MACRHSLEPQTTGPSVAHQASQLPNKVINSLFLPCEMDLLSGWVRLSQQKRAILRLSPVTVNSQVCCLPFYNALVYLCQIRTSRMKRSDCCQLVCTWQPLQTECHPWTLSRRTPQHASQLQKRHRGTQLPLCTCRELFTCGLVPDRQGSHTADPASSCEQHNATPHCAPQEKREAK